MSRRPLVGFAWLGLLVVVSCGGTVIVADDDAGAGKGGTGVSGSGGTPSTGGTAGVSGTGGGASGTGGVSGTGGGESGTGGGVVCPPIADCNWCGGKAVYDAYGCEIGYVCANGVDPCTTSPCFGPEDCAPNETCADMLCWGAGQLTCTGMACAVGTEGGSQTCDCEWSCSDGNAYAFSCYVSSSGSYSCDCMMNGFPTGGCGAGGMGGSGGMGGMGGTTPPPMDACILGECCVFPQ